MKIAVLGCGAIGGLFLGYLSGKGYAASGIVRDYQQEVLKKEGLLIVSPKAGEQKIEVKVSTSLCEKVDLAIFATKINGLKEIIEQNIPYLKDATVLSTQNGIRADYILNEYFPKEKIITGIVMFGATFYAPNKVVHNFEGDLILGNIFNSQVDDFDKVEEILASTFSTARIGDIKGAKYLKLFINLNNCIPATLGLSMQETFASQECAKLAIHLNREAYEIVKKCEIELESLPSYPRERIEGLASAPVDEAAVILSKVMTTLSKEPLYGSILQSIKRGKVSEIDYINGEIVKLAESNGLLAPLNKKITEAVHAVEKKGEFFTEDGLFQHISN